MTCKLKQKITKNANENWVLYLNSNFTLSKDDDSRDNVDLFNENEKNIYVLYRQKIKENTGWVGFDRQYIDDNTLEITHYFNTESGARLYYDNSKNKNIAEVNVFSKLLQYKIKNSIAPRYATSWHLFNDNDEEMNL